MKCSVTGGAGFIGSAIVKALVARGDEVTVLDDLSTGRLANLTDVRHLIKFSHSDIVCDPKVQPHLNTALEGAEVIFHEAALTSVPGSVENPQHYTLVNDLGFVNVLTAARETGVKRVVYASSSSVYGDRVGVMHEGLTPIPESPYALTKLVNEFYAEQYRLHYGLEAVGLRYFNVYGPNQRPDGGYAAVIPRFLEAIKNGQPLEIHGSGRQTRDFIHVDDVVKANLLAASAPAGVISGKVFNVGSGRAVSVLGITEILEGLIGRPLERRFIERRAGDVQQTLADTTRASAELGFRANIQIDAGLSELCRAAGLLWE